MGSKKSNSVYSLFLKETIGISCETAVLGQKTIEVRIGELRGGVLLTSCEEGGDEGEDDDQDGDKE